MTELTGIFYNYTMAEIAQLLGMNYDSTDGILYRGSNSANGFRVITYNSSNTNGTLRINGVDVYQGAWSNGRNLRYQQIEGGGCAFSFANPGCLDMIVARYKNINDDTYGDCYLLINSNNMYVIFDDDADTARFFYPNGISLSNIRKRSPVGGSSYTDNINTNTISISPLIIPMTSTNARIIQGVYLPTEFPPLRNGYTEFTLNNETYISLSTGGSESYGRFIVKEAISA